MDDDDLEILIDKCENLLEYFDFKVMELTTNSRNASYEMFKRTNGMKVEK